MLVTWSVSDKPQNPYKSGFDTFCRKTLLALTTNCGGGPSLTAQPTHIYLILSLILLGRRDRAPWSIKCVTDLTPHAQFREMQQNKHEMVQHIWDAMP